MARAQVNSHIELEYEEFGDPAAEPLVLIMGIGAQMILWHPQFCQQLADLGYRVIRFDNRDAGLSTKLKGQKAPDVLKAIGRRLVGGPVDAPYTLVDMADDTVGLLDALGCDSAHIVGASLGGMVAQTLAIAHPHRVRSLASIMSTTGDLWAAVPRPKALRALVGKRARVPQDAIDNARFFYDACGSKAFPIDWEWIDDVAAQAFERSYYPAGFIRQFAAMLATPPRFRALRFARMPTAVIHGSEDPLIPPSGGRATARAVPGAQLHIIRGMGHDLPRGAWPQIHSAIDANARRAAMLPASSLRAVASHSG